MHDGVGLGVLHRADDDVAIGEVALDEGGARVDGLAVALGQVVENGDLMAGVDEFLGTDAADVALRRP